MGKDYSQLQHQELTRPHRGEQGVETLREKPEYEAHKNTNKLEFVNERINKLFQDGKYGKFVDNGTCA